MNTDDLGPRKRKAPAADPLNSEIERLAAAAARKKSRNAAATSSRPTLTTNITQKKNRQASVEDVDDDEDQPSQRRFPKNPNHIIESDEDDDSMPTTSNTPKENFSKGSVPVPPMATMKPNQNRNSVDDGPHHSVPKNKTPILELDDSSEDEEFAAKNKKTARQPSTKKQTAKGKRNASEPSTESAEEELGEKCIEYNFGDL